MRSVFAFTVLAATMCLTITSVASAQIITPLSTMIAADLAKQLPHANGGTNSEPGTADSCCVNFTLPDSWRFNELNHTAPVDSFGDRDIVCCNDSGQNAGTYFFSPELCEQISQYLPRYHPPINSCSWLTNENIKCGGPNFWEVGGNCLIGLRFGTIRDESGDFETFFGIGLSIVD